MQAKRHSPQLKCLASVKRADTRKIQVRNKRVFTACLLPHHPYCCCSAGEITLKSAKLAEELDGVNHAGNQHPHCEAGEGVEDDLVDRPEGVAVALKSGLVSGKDIRRRGKHEEHHDEGGSIGKHLSRGTQPGPLRARHGKTLLTEHCELSAQYHPVVGTPVRGEFKDAIERRED